MRRTLPLLTLVALLSCVPAAARAQKGARLGAAREQQVAVRFAPVFWQALGDHPRADYVTDFDFDGDWRGGRYDPTGLSAEAVLAHENDMEGCLVVAEKDGDDPARARVILVETLAHDRFHKYAPEGTNAPASFERVRLEGPQPLLFIEAKGHGVLAYEGGDKQESRRGTLVYTYAGRAEDPEATGKEKEAVGYELVSLYDTIWRRALAGSKETFGEVTDFGAQSFEAAGAKRPSKRAKKLGRLGASFLGDFGAPNAARPPWGWFDRSERGRPRGEWFFDPAATAKRRLGRGADFSTAYLHAPFLGLFRR